MDLEEDEVHYSGDDDFLYSDDSVSDDDLAAEPHKKNYRIMKEEEIQESQENDIALLSNALSLSRVAACMLLHRYKWNVENAQEAWFSDEDAVRKALGLVKKPPIVGKTEELELVCGICFETYVCDTRIESTVGFCGHSFCIECLAAYIRTAINDGPGCLFLRCPDPSCAAAVGQDMVDLLVPDEDRNKYRRYLVRSYIEENQKTKWCPAPDCGSAIEYEVGSDESCDVLCNCWRGFCWRCSEDAHNPVDCGTVAKWMLKNRMESENVSWVLANSKPCPKCKVPIEKNDGCMHMTCRPPCGYEFCWLCLGSWSQHGATTGGYYACNIYNKSLTKQDQGEERRGDDIRIMSREDMAKISLDRYTHYFERWDANHKSREKALEDLHDVKTVQLQKLEGKHGQSAEELKFVTEAWLQIAEGRRVLKWTYAYGYYLPYKQQSEAKTKLFEFLQGEAEAALGRLHQCAEKELQVYFDNGHTDAFGKQFRPKLINLTLLTRNYFSNLVGALERMQRRTQELCSLGAKVKLN